MPPRPSSKSPLGDRSSRRTTADRSDIHVPSPPGPTSLRQTNAQADKIGPKIRHARQLKRLRLKDAAARVGCSESLLSKIECGKTQPSLRMLHAITQALDTSIASLFSDPAREEVSIFRRGARSLVGVGEPTKGAGIRLERLTSYRNGQTIDGNIHIVSPGAWNGGAIHHQGEEIGYVLQGTLELSVGSTTYLLEPGDSFHFPSELPHSYRNPGRTTTRVIWINTPPTF